jgi:hypothetical protein
MTLLCCLPFKSAADLAKKRLIDFLKSIGRPYNAQTGDEDAPENQKKRSKGLKGAAI